MLWPGSLTSVSARLPSGPGSAPLVTIKSHPL